LNELRLISFSISQLLPSSCKISDCDAALFTELAHCKQTILTTSLYTYAPHVHRCVFLVQPFPTSAKCARRIFFVCRVAPRRCERRLAQVRVHKGASPPMMHLAARRRKRQRVSLSVSRTASVLWISETRPVRLSRALQKNFSSKKRERARQGHLRCMKVSRNICILMRREIILYMFLGDIA
jgi:hypothetical protein